MGTDNFDDGLAELFRKKSEQMVGAGIELYSSRIWPVQRLFVKNKKERCSSCILTDDFNIANGLCEACRVYENKKHTPSRLHTGELDIKNKEAFLLLSGGKDSAYVLDRCRKYFPDLHITCIFVNTGFMSPLAMTNARSVAEKTQTDLLIVNNHIDEFKSVLRQAFLDLGRNGSYGVIDFAEGSLVFDIGQQIAGEKPIISGLTHAQLDHIETGDTDDNMIFPLDWWRVSEEEIQNAGLVSGTPLTTNSQLIPAMIILDFKILGYSSFEPEFAQLIREGKANRLEWLYRFETLEYLVSRGFLDKTLEQGLSSLDLTPQQVLVC